MGAITAGRADLAARSRRARLAREWLTALLTHGVLIAGSLVMLLPFVWMISTSLKLEGEVFVGHLRRL